MKIHRLSLPSPISANNLFRDRSEKERERGEIRRTKTREYNDWIKSALAQLALQKRPCCLGRVAITIYVGHEATAIKDIDNCVKATIDALVTAEIIPKDSRAHVRAVTAFWVVNMAGMVVAIEEDPPEPSAAEIIALLPENSRRVMV